MKNDRIQDKSKRMAVVVAKEVANIVFRTVQESQVKFREVNYVEACKYIALTSKEQECRIGPLKRVLPQRRYTNGAIPGVTGEDPQGLDSDLPRKEDNCGKDITHCSPGYF